MEGDAEICVEAPQCVTAASSWQIAGRASDSENPLRSEPGARHARGGVGATIRHAPPDMTSSSVRVLRVACPPFLPACDASCRSTEKLRFDALTASPPLRPAVDARSGFLAKLRCSPGTLLPPLRAISRCRSGVIDAKPLRDLVVAETVSIRRAPILRRRLLRNNRSGRGRSANQANDAGAVYLSKRRLSDVHFR